MSGLKLSQLDPKDVEMVPSAALAPSGPMKLSQLDPTDVQPVEPSFADQAWQKTKEFGNAVVEDLPGLGAMAGGTLGGVTSGPVGAIAGAGAGGYGGEALKNLIHTYTDPEKAPKDNLSYVTEPLKAGVVGAVGESVGLGIAPLFSSAKKALPKIASKAGEFLTGIPEKELQTYSAQTGAVNRMIKESGGDMTLAADQARERLQSGLRKTKDTLNKQISAFLNNAPVQKTINIDPVIKNLQVARSKINTNLSPEAASEIEDMISRIGKNADENGLVNIQDMQDIKNFLQERAKNAYLKGGQLFSSARESQQAAKKAGAEALGIINPLAPEIKEANRQLQQLHYLEGTLNKNLITPNKPDSALFAAGGGNNDRNARMLKVLGKITNQDALGEAERLAAAKRFANPPLAPVDSTGKSLLRTGVGTGLGFMMGGAPGAMVGGAATSPAVTKLAINLGRPLAEKLGQAAGALGDRAAKTYSNQILGEQADTFSKVLTPSSPVSEIIKKEPVIRPALVASQEEKESDPRRAEIRKLIEKRRKKKVRGIASE